jgi:MEMO1 family protein
MSNLFTSLWVAVFFLAGMSGCHSQDTNKPVHRIDRPPAVAGQFYPADPALLRATLADLFAKAKPASVKNVVAIICPHAGYEFSGIVAASSVNQVDPDKQYDNIFIIGSSHHVAFMGGSIYNIGDYETPLGKVSVNTELANKLIRENPVFTFNAEADKNEHSIEVEIPFLQYHMKKEFTIVPIVLGTQSPQSCKKIAQALKPYLNERNLFVISTDFSHYPPYQDAIANDKRSCDAVLSNSPDKLQKTIIENDARDIPNLATSMCGWTSVLTLLDITSSEPGIKLTPIIYMNSGDSKSGDKTQVVGYWGIAVSRTDEPPKAGTGFNLNLKEKKTLLTIARNTITEYIEHHKTPPVDTGDFSPNLKMHSGAFVTLKENGELRGCIGRFSADEPLYRVVQEMAIAAATEDNRFPQVVEKEITKIEIEISVLSPMKKIGSPDEIVMGRDGIYIKKGWHSGTFLPQVATETGWTREEFLGHCSRDKAGIGWEGWRDAELYTYQAAVFSESSISGHKD